MKSNKSGVFMEFSRTKDSAGRPCLYRDSDSNPVTGNRPVLALCFGGDNS